MWLDRGMYPNRGRIVGTSQNATTPYVLEIRPDDNLRQPSFGFKKCFGVLEKLL